MHCTRIPLCEGLYTFLCITLQTELLIFSLNCVNIMCYGWKTYLSCQTILMILYIEQFKWYILFLRWPTKGKGWVYVLFVFSLFNNAVSISDFISPSNQMTAVNWKGNGRMGCWHNWSYQLDRGKYEKLSWESQFFCWGLNQAPPEI
jgi:hypothetical protein